jgi:hypothetical protein
MMLIKATVMACALAVAGCAHAQTPSSPAKKELIAKVLQLQQPGIEGISRSLAEQPAAQLMQQASQVLQRMPAERRDAVARDIEADVRKYVEEATPIVRDRALKLAPSTIGAVLEERFNEDELKQIVALLESPVNKKFQAAFPDMQKALAEKLVAETRGEIEGKVRTLQASVAQRLGVTVNQGGAASAPKAAAPAKK